MWTPTPQANTTWSVRRSGSVRRIAEDGRRRLTEAGVIRIIDRFERHWIIPISSPDPWQPS